MFDSLACNSLSMIDLRDLLANPHFLNLQSDSPLIPVKSLCCLLQISVCGFFCCSISLQGRAPLRPFFCADLLLTSKADDLGSRPSLVLFQQRGQLSNLFDSLAPNTLSMIDLISSSHCLHLQCDSPAKSFLVTWWTTDCSRFSPSLFL